MKIQMGLDNMKSMLKLLNDPQNDLKVIHVAGTNGKGSVCAHLSTLLKHHYQKVGCYNSPHLLHPSDAIRVNGTCIPRDKYVELQQKLSQFQASEFEKLTAIAILWFREQKVDIAIIEVGMGGLTDATNVFQDVAVSVLTSVGHDHIEQFGSYEELVRQKVGIARRIFVVSQQQDRYVADQAELHCLLKGVKFVQTKEYSVDSPLKCEYQKFNLNTALTVIEQLGLDVEKLKHHVKDVKWPGRLEWHTVKDSRFVLVDGAHNEEACQALKEYLGQGFDATFIFGCTQGKDYKKLIHSVVDQQEVYVVNFQQPEGMPWIQCEDAFKMEGYRGYATVREAIDDCQSQVVVLFGSLYLVADFYRQFKIEPQ